MHTLLIAVLCALVPIQESPVDLQAAVRTVREAPLSLAADAIEKRQAAVAVIGCQPRGTEPDSIRPLLRLVREDPAWCIWQDALRTACSIAAPGDVPEIVAAVRTELESTAGVDLGSRDERIYRTSTLAGMFVRECLALLPDGGRGAEPLLQLLTEMEVPQQHRWYIGGDPLAAALALLASDEARRDHIVQYLERKGRHGQAPEQWESLGFLKPYANQRLMDGLYQVIQRDARQGRPVNRTVAGVLAEWGDARLLPVLKEAQATEGADYAAEPIWQLETQNPPSRLLSSIAASDARTLDIDRRRWALDRAVERGLAQEDLVVALARYFDARVDSFDWRIGALALKAQGVRLGLIERSDFAHVPYVDPCTWTPADGRPVGIDAWVYGEGR